MRVFLQSIIFQLTLTPYVCWRGFQALPNKKWMRLLYLLFFAVELAVYFFGFFFHSEIPDKLMIGIEYFCGTWYVATIYITLTLLLLELLRFTNKKFFWFPRWITNHWEKTKSTLLSMTIVGVTILLIHAYQTVQYPKVTDVYLTLPKKNSTRDSLKIVMMSDLHIGEMIGKKNVQRFVRMSNEQHPDMVVIAGDVIDYESRFAENAHIEEDLKQLKAPLGVYGIYGNHEYRANRFAKFRWFTKTGITFLVDSVVSPDSTFTIIGRDDYINYAKRKTLHSLMKTVDKHKPTIVLEHQPWSFDELTMNNVDLGLYGHTHNGQLWPYPLLLRLVYECSYGYYKKGTTQFYVSSGIGIAGAPYRVGTISELVVLHIRFKN